jgi:lysophospholipid acyltransferase (LPLAT)-like uncharacterized protein
MRLESTLTRGQKAKAAAIAALASPAIGVLCRTLHFHVEGAHHYDDIHRSGHQPILALWHGRILPGLFYLRHRGIVVITSRNFDGEWIARILARYGFGTARGSSSNGGARALVQLRRDLAEGRPAAFTVDGPRGPARVAQPGVIWLAGATGNPILPFHIETDRCWTLSSWDRTQIPKPFSRVAIVFGAPLSVRGSEPDEVERKRLELESTLRVLEQRAHVLIRTGGSDRAAHPTGVR